MKTTFGLWPVLTAFIFLFVISPSVYAASPGRDIALVLRGTGKTIGSVLQLPVSMLSDSTQVMFPFGLVTGGIKGTVRAVAGTVSGAFDIARGAAPYAKYAAFI